MEQIKVVMYSKENCMLCNIARIYLEDLQEEFPIVIDEIDIYKDDELLEKYMLNIPLVEIDGEEVQSVMVDKDVIRKRLQEKISSFSVE